MTFWAGERVRFKQGLGAVDQEFSVVTGQPLGGAIVVKDDEHYHLIAPEFLELIA